jgi:transcriptional regulator GlxA family with amidase domain
MLNLSKRQLNRVLKKHYGMCFREKLCRARMDRAGWLLNTTEMSVSKICEEVGYLSETSFYKAFKRHYKMSPSKYREYMKKYD